MANGEQLLTLAKSAQDALQQGELERAEQLTETFLASDGTDRHWGLSLLDTILGRMRSETHAEQEQKRLADRQQILRAELLRQGEEGDDEVWVHAWERARLLNVRAWDVVEHGGSRPEHERALQDVERSLAFWPYFFPNQDTRARLLLGLDRPEEAYSTLRWLDALQPGWPDMAGLIASRGYRAWLEEHTYDPLDLPEGSATAREELPQLHPEMRSAPDSRLCGAERIHLRRARAGLTEWHRARNAALVALVLEGLLSPEEIVAMAPQQADLSLGLIRSGPHTANPSEDTVDKLRHWMLWAANNHPVVSDHHPPPGIRGRLFLRWSQEPMTVEDVERILADMGRRIGIEGLSPWRCQRLRFERFHCGVIGEAERRRSLQPIQPAGDALLKTETVATAMAWCSRGEDTYIPYTYEVDGVGYGFVYLTPYDELHRFYGDHPAEWYDELTRSTSFRVGYDADDPRQHRVLDPRFDRLNGRARFVGTATTYVTDSGDVDFKG